MALKEIDTDLLIIGGGLTGLSLAYLLRSQTIKTTLVEARDRLGGRILTKYNPNLAPLDLGPSWFGKKHGQLVNLLQELDLDIFEQKIGKQAIYEAISTSPPYLVQMPANPDPSFRIKDGSQSLISKLSMALDPKQILLNQTIFSIDKKENDLKAQSKNLTIRAKQIVSTLPQTY